MGTWYCASAMVLMWQDGQSSRPQARATDGLLLTASSDSRVPACITRLPKWKRDSAPAHRWSSFVAATPLARRLFFLLTAAVPQALSFAVRTSAGACPATSSIASKHTRELPFI